MYQGRFISVALATYNGEQYIVEQMQSIVNQTVKPDEIVISDDGSSDGTLDIINDLNLSSYGIKCVVLCNNPKPGFGGNFEWAMQHTNTKGEDIIIICDQDDVWYNRKIECIVNAFINKPEAVLIFHNAVLVDKNRNVLPIKFDENADVFEMHSLSKYERNRFLTKACSSVVTQGMVMSVTRAFFDSCCPFPYGYAHDSWLISKAVIMDEAFYLNEILGERRLHDSNTIGISEYQHRSLLKKVFRIKSKLKTIYDICPQINKDMRIMYELKICGLDSTDTYKYMQITNCINQTVISAYKSCRIKGGLILCKLYLSSNRYRNSGRSMCFYQLYTVLRFSKRDRVSFLENSGY